MHSLNTLNRGLSAKESLATVKNYQTSDAVKVLKVVTFGIFAGIYALYRHFHEESQVKSYAQFAGKIANGKDLTGVNDITIEAEGGPIQLQEMHHGGRTWVSLRRGDEWVFCPSNIKSIKQVQTMMQLDISEDSETYAKFGVTYNKSEFESQAAFEKAQNNLQKSKAHHVPTVTNDYLCKDNMLSAEPLGHTTISQVKMITYKNGDIYYFKPLATDNAPSVSVAAKVGGITPRNEKFAERSILTYQMAQTLGFDVIPETVMTEDEDGNLGYAQKMASGKSGKAVLAGLNMRQTDPAIGADPFGRVKSDPVIVRKMIELQMLDALMGQADRHRGNYHISLAEREVYGIDNDICAGQFVTHPHNMVPSRISEGFGKNGSRPSEREKGILKHLQSLKDPDPVRKMTVGNGPSAGWSVFLPPIMDKNMVGQFKALTHEKLMSHMEHFTDSEQRAACFRLDAIKSHIDVLEKRQALVDDKLDEIDSEITKLQASPLGSEEQIDALTKQRAELLSNVSIIEKDEWGSKPVTDILFMDNAGKYLDVFTNYLQRDTQRQLDKPGKWSWPKDRR